MKTDDLISLLATGIRPVDPHIMRRAFVRALCAGAAGALLLLTMTYGVRPDIRVMLVTPIFRDNRVIAYFANDSGAAAVGWGFGLAVAGMFYVPLVEESWRTDTARR